MLKDWLARDKKKHWIFVPDCRMNLLRAVMLCEIRLIGFIDKSICLLINDGVVLKGDDSQIRESWQESRAHF